MATNGEIKFTVKQGAVGVGAHQVTLFDRDSGYTVQQKVTGSGAPAGVLGEVLFTDLDTTKDYYAIVRAPANDATGDALIFDFLRPKAAGPTDPLWSQVQYLQDLSGSAAGTALTFNTVKGGNQLLGSFNATRGPDRTFGADAVAVAQYQGASGVRSYSYLAANASPGDKLDVNFGEGFCMEFWMRMTGDTSNGVCIALLGDSATDSACPLYIVSYGGSGTGAGTGRLADQNFEIIAAGLTPGSGWHHIAAVFGTFGGSGRLALYIDGAWAGSTACDLTTRKLKGLSFGDAPDGGYKLNPGAFLEISDMRMTNGPTPRYPIGGMGSSITVPTAKHPAG